MCGIAGILDINNNHSPEWMEKNILAMTGRIRHRGPDGWGVWRDTDVPLVLGHRRLSIIDISENGHQPMVSNDQRYALVYNGEIYNFKELKKELDKDRGSIRWRGYSDTEVLLTAIEVWGVHQTIIKLNGMFAFAVWDSREKMLHLIRDRIGKKPLFYGWGRGLFLFASELKAFDAVEDLDFPINRNALALLLRVNFIPSPHSIFENIYKLPPATVLSLPLNIFSNRSNFSPFPKNTSCPGVPFFYWSAKKAIEELSLRPHVEKKEDLLQELDVLCRDAVEKRMVSDVPIGAFLSGGIDSSLVVAIMQSLCPQPVKTFSIGFNEGKNEAPFAREIAKFLGTDHTELFVSPEMLLDNVSILHDLCDEPIGDTAVLPTYLVSQLARKKVTVALSGDGGDELFAGYPRYIWAQERWCREHKRFDKIPKIFKHLFERTIKSIPEGVMQQLPFGDKLNDAAFLIGLRSPEDVYHYLIDHWQDSVAVVLDSQGVDSVVTTQQEWAEGVDCIQRMVYMDLAGRLPDSIVSKVDRASMYVSLETRCPLLDYRLVELSMKIPTDMKIHNGQGKRILRELLYRYVPQKMVDRPKVGFKIPLGQWLKGPLRDWAEALLAERRLRDEDFFNVDAVRSKWQEHITGAREWQYNLWDILMFQLWNENRKRT
jgi:asparagine synthase (glutamine-hydrolysing)